MILFVNAFRAVCSVLCLFMSAVQACAGLSVFRRAQGSLTAPQGPQIELISSLIKCGR